MPDQVPLPSATPRSVAGALPTPSDIGFRIETTSPVTASRMLALDMSSRASFSRVWLGLALLGGTFLLGISTMMVIGRISPKTPSAPNHMASRQDAATTTTHAVSHFPVPVNVAPTPTPVPTPAPVITPIADNTPPVTPPSPQTSVPAAPEEPQSRTSAHGHGHPVRRVNLSPEDRAARAMVARLEHQCCVSPVARNWTSPSGRSMTCPPPVGSSDWRALHCGH